jgi:hypothetical protein
MRRRKISFNTNFKHCSTVPKNKPLVKPLAVKYDSGMSKTLLIAGKEFPDGADFAAAAKSSQRDVVITVDAESQESAPDNFHIVEWRKHSPISAHSLIIETENLYQKKIDEAILLFDSPWFSMRYSELTTQVCAQALDDMLAGYILLTTELLSRLSGEGELIFALREDKMQHEDKIQGDGILPATGAGAFRTFAERIAASCAEHTSLSVLLIEIDAHTDDVAFGVWLFPYLDTLSGGILPDRKKNQQWIKCGAKTATRFPFIR